jgi:GSH-dependent disulfide-bond oxidoreductase
MIELYCWPRPNGHKITLFLEEAGPDYTSKPVKISAGDQFKPKFLTFSPNNRMPAIIDDALSDHGGAGDCFRIGHDPPTSRKRQAGSCPQTCAVEGRDGVDVLAHGQPRTHGRPEPSLQRYAPEKIPYAINRYLNETNRLYASWIVVSPTGHS